ncbi:hypothetical protein BDA96_01G522700 [Sorghum bicolor]|uniref:Uncharacterized protein n=1 Tax=Sorghum bicolor TaxID=4558 RepID=A0A921S6I6_SORBI|nr:hypothetical protein BDA96_01G522700 [Sorghum bicolor]
MLLVSALIQVVAPPLRPAPASARFSVIINGGSTGTRAHVFATGHDSRPDLARLPGPLVLRCRRGAGQGVSEAADRFREGRLALRAAPLRRRRCGSWPPQGCACSRKWLPEICSDEGISNVWVATNYALGSLDVPLDDKRIEYSNQVGGIQVEWALGAFITLMQNTSLKPLYSAAKSTHSNRPLFAVLGMFLLCGVLFVSRWRKPKTKFIHI